MNTVKIEIDIKDDNLRETIYETINVETQATVTERGLARIENTDTSLVVFIEAKDYVALRAITNSIMRLIQASVDVAESISE